MLSVVGTGAVGAFPRPIEAWGGAECTINRTGDVYRNQLTATGHQDRGNDTGLLASLGLDALRVPVLWEMHYSLAENGRSWAWADRLLGSLRRESIRPIVGLLHHGSGPHHTSLLDPDFAPGLSRHANAVATRYPWVKDWTPINEPLTTARFSALYGIWYPHLRDETAFWLALLNQVDAVRLAMAQIRTVRPDARLIQTEDLGRTYATVPMRGQAEYDNQRRWMTWDLLCGAVGPDHPLWDRLCDLGFGERLGILRDNPCPPQVIGINHYLTSDRFLDHRLGQYPTASQGGNGHERYADVEAVRVLAPPIRGLARAIAETWQRYRTPIALTEIHNGCTREEQSRWLTDAWRDAREAHDAGVDIRAVTAWALFGSQGWNTLLTSDGEYEPGVFDVSAGRPRETALAATVRSRGMPYGGEGWWLRDSRLAYPPQRRPAAMRELRHNRSFSYRRPVLIAGASGTLGQALARECEQRDIAHVLTGRCKLDLCDPEGIGAALTEFDPWAVINATGWVKVDDAEADERACRAINVAGAAALAKWAHNRGIPSVSFSSDLVFDGLNAMAYTEGDIALPLNAYGRSKQAMEAALAALDGDHLVIRTSAFFSPHDPYNFAVQCLNQLSLGGTFAAVSDAVVSPTYVPHLCRAVMDLLLDGESGIWHLANADAVSWHEFGSMLCAATGVSPKGLSPARCEEMNWPARRPPFSALASARGRLMPPIEPAIAQFAAIWRPFHGNVAQGVSQ